LVAEKFGGSGVGDGFGFMLTNASDHFHMILKRDNPSFNELPGLTVLLGGMWIANLNYWGCNQYITQRALGADLQTARSGILFAAFLKLLMPVIVILPGIAAFVLHQQGDFASSGLAESPDKAYPLLMNLLPVGLKGLAFAALTAAIVASLAGKANSIATIFSLDIYKKKINLVADDAQVVKIGRYTVLVSLIIAVIIAPLLLGGSRGVLQFIQEYTGFVSPGIFAMFIMGFFWKNTTSNAALFATIGGFLLSIFLKFLPLFVNLSFLATSGFAKANASGIFEIPFLDRMGFVFLLCIIAMVAISYWDKKNGITTNPLEVDTKLFSVNTSFAVAALIILGILVALYTAFW
jgi:SSS family solute:Na+ symporter